MVKGQCSREHSLARFEMQERVVGRKQAICRSAEDGICGSQRRVGGITPGGVGTSVLIGGQSSGRGKGGSRRQGTGKI